MPGRERKWRSLENPGKDISGYQREKKMRGFFGFPVR